MTAEEFERRCDEIRKTESHAMSVLAQAKKKRSKLAEDLGAYFDVDLGWSWKYDNTWYASAEDVIRVARQKFAKESDK